MKHTQYMLIFLTYFFIVQCFGMATEDKPTRTVTPEEVRHVLSEVPSFFEDVPAQYNSAMVTFLKDYVEKKGGREVVDYLLAVKEQVDPEEWNEIRLSALGDALGFAVESRAGYIFFSNKEDTNLLKGRRFDFMLNKLFELERKQDQVTDDEQKIMSEKSDLKRTITSEMSQKKRDEVTQKINELEVQFLQKMNEFDEVGEEIIFTQSILAGLYKIHLMPEGSLVPFLRTFVEIIKGSEELQKNIHEFKLLPDPNYKQGNETFARVVIYPSGGQTKAQQALDALYYALQGVKGLGATPRYNVRVNDLIFVAQGDADFKKPEFADYYERPARVYYRPNFIRGQRKNFHLVHPETKQPLIVK